MIAPFGSGARSSRRRLRLACGFVCLLLELVALRTLWLDREFTHGQVLRGVFEEHGDRPVLVVAGGPSEPTFPGPGLDQDGELFLTPGLTVVIPLRVGDTYGVTAEDGPAPYVVFGKLDSSGGVSSLSEVKRVAVRDERLEFVPWDAGASWRSDSEWLSDIAHRCGATDQRAPTFSIVRTAAGLSLRVGACAIETRAADQPEAFAVLAGPYWARVSRHNGFALTWVMDGNALLEVLALSVIVLLGALAVGVRLALAASALLVVASVMWPFPSRVIFFTAVPIALLFVAITLADRTVPHRSRYFRSFMGALGGLLTTILLVLIIRWRFAQSGFVEKDWHGSAIEPSTMSAEPAACGLMGYSSVDDSHLRERGGLDEMLEHCAPCKGRLFIASRHGGTLDWVRRELCSGTMPPGAGTIAVVAGNNDDMLWVGDRADYWSDALAVLRFAHAAFEHRLHPEDLTRALDALSATSLHGDQRGALTEAIRCANEKGYRLALLHEFFISDLPRGRSANRRRLFEQRRAAFDAAGRSALLVNSLDAFGSDIGVSWFNDMRHPSLVGHRRLADRICAIVADSRPARAGG